MQINSPLLTSLHTQIQAEPKKVPLIQVNGKLLSLLLFAHRVSSSSLYKKLICEEWKEVVLNLKCGNNGSNSSASVRLFS